MIRIWFALLLAASSLPAQNSYGRVTGRVADDSGAVIAGAAIQAVQLSTNITTTAASNHEGVYELLNLLPGVYRLTAQTAGFKRTERGPIDVRVGDIVTIDFALQVGAVTESVEVRDEAPLIDTATASTGQVIDQKLINEMPLPGGAVTYLMQLSPGVVSLNAPTHGWLPQARDSIANLAVGGSRAKSSEFQLDGMPNMGQGGNLGFSPPPEMIQEFRIQTNAYDATVGRFTGAQVNMVPKAGANDFHGTLWFSHLSRPLMTHPFFINRQLYDTATGPPTREKRSRLWPATKTNRYRISVTGPVEIPRLYHGRNRTFFSYGNDFMLRTFAGQINQTVPTAEQRTGDFSRLLALGAPYQIYDPATIRATPGGFSRQPIPGNRIPASRLDPAAQRLLQFYPQPNTPGTADFRNNLIGANFSRIDYQAHMARIDHVLGEKHRLYLSGNGVSVQGDQGRNLNNDANGNLSDGQTRSAVLDDVYMFSPTLVLNTRYGVSRIVNASRPPTMGFDLATLGWNQALLSQTERAAWHLPQIDIDSYATIGSNLPSNTATLYHFFSSTATAVRGKHSVRFGFDYRILQEHGYNPGNYVGNLGFSSNWTRGPLDTSPVAPIGQGLASFLLGIPTGGGIDRNAALSQQSSYAALFIHDDFKVSRKLTLNLGLRWEYELPITERFNRANRGWDFNTPSPISAAALANYARSPIPDLPPSAFRTLGGIGFAGVNGAPRGIWRPDRNNYSPRIGFAYLLRPKTVFRAGYGIFYETFGTDRVDAGQVGFDQRTSLVPSFDNGQSFAAGLRNPFPGGLLAAQGAAGGLNTFLGRAPSYFDVDRRMGYLQRWSANLQQELPGRMMVEIGYAASRGAGLGLGRNLNAVPNSHLSTSRERDQAAIDLLTRANLQNPFFGLPEFNGTGLQGRLVSRNQLVVPYPHFASINTTTGQGYSWYHAGHLRFDRRFGSGYLVGASYTWSKFMEAVELLNAADPMPHRVISPQDRPHHLVVHFQAELPWARNRWFGGWSTQAIYQWQSGPPIGFGNAIYRGDWSNITLPYADRTVERWFNTAGFEQNPQRQLGSNVRTLPLRFSGLRADGWNNWDLSFFKNFRFRERATLQLRVEAQDALNHAMFAAPNTAPTNTLFGQVTATIWSEQRKASVAAKILW
ncbi:MAG: carboxypeptidase regulatory-like domain-containing protein [Acidobacteria bacterium]|nr:carboxypeptidase regulatory-like domain-containing protein [Acidobacteriota bacterium]